MIQIYQIIISFCIGLVCGASLMLQSWDGAAQRGIFEVGHHVYRVVPVEQ